MTYLAENLVSDVECSQAIRGSITDWEILNHTNPTRLKRILMSRSEHETTNIEETCNLISAYHQVYRRGLMQLRQQRHSGSCPPPTSEQLQQIADLLQQNGKVTTSQQILAALQLLAQRLRRK